MKNWRFLSGALALSLVLSLCPGAGAQKVFKKKKKPAKTEDQAASAEPDKVLYNRAMDDLKHNKYTEGRLALQTLINTYPDSEYLAKAKLAVADSFYKEGGTSNLTQSIQEYKDFITFFPFLDEASYAQMQVGMAHYKLMEKSDRDTAQAQQAEDEFQTMLLKYPQSTYAPQAEQHLREVQEVLADGDYRVAHFYYQKQDFRAATARLIEIADRYPLYSQSDEVLWMLGDVYSRMKTAVKNEDQKNHWADLAGECYARIIREYPQSRRVKESKSRLVAMGMTVPAADPAALAQVQKEQAYQKQHHTNPVIQNSMGMIKGSPDVSHAAHSGPPNLNPPNDTLSASTVLLPNAPGPTFNMNGSVAANAEAEPTTQVDALTGGGTSSLSGATPIGTTAAAQIIEAPTSAPPASGNAAGSGAATAPTPPANAAPSAPLSSAPTTPPAGGSAPAPAAAPAPAPAPDSGNSSAPAASSTGQGANAPPPLSSGAGSSTAASTTDSQSGTSSATGSNDPKQESTSKKKKGIKKVIPF
ncbi:MAG TPA: outer membrane protein assembly factor BamD [Candidatus Limnocylindrales bacterium]|nr:outer membrane protein assembly factor BamD [Candidatus Limnocylindrales bacterium]